MSCSHDAPISCSSGPQLSGHPIVSTATAAKAVASTCDSPAHGHHVHAVRHQRQALHRQHVQELQVVTGAQRSNVHTVPTAEGGRGGGKQSRRGATRGAR